MKMSNLRHPTYSSLLDKFLVTRLLDKKKKIIGNSKYVHDQEVNGINQSPCFFFWLLSPHMCLRDLYFSTVKFCFWERLIWQMLFDFFSQNKCYLIYFVSGESNWSSYRASSPKQQIQLNVVKFIGFELISQLVNYIRGFLVKIPKLMGTLQYVRVEICTLNSLLNQMREFLTTILLYQK